ncbi:MAG: mandelate racemase/muconate lactonizing enzyme family protein [Beutenbergiaceae bacterium]
MTSIDSVDIFYLAVPQIRDIGDGSQDMALVRVRAGEHTGWGECEASPLPTIAALVTPMSHSACHPVADSVLGAQLEHPADILAIGERVRARSLDLLQAEHTLSGIEIALWDLLGKVRGVGVHALLGNPKPTPKTAYASTLFGDTPQETFRAAQQIAAAGYRAAKFGWGPYGTGDVDADADQVHAAREGLGSAAALLIDAGTVWHDDVDAAAARLPALESASVLLLEEPFVSGALGSYAALAKQSPRVRLAAGEGAHNRFQARHLIDYGGIGFVQVDTGRIGGIAPAADVAAYASERGVQFINHTFTTHLALSASLQPYAHSSTDWLCEYPVEASELARALVRNPLIPDADGTITIGEGPGLGIELDLDAVRPYLLDTDITVAGRTLYRTPPLVP